MSSSTSIPTSAAMPVAIDYASLTMSSLVGGLLAFMLGGMLVMQSYIYHISFPQDRIGLRLYVYLVVLLLVTALAFTAFETYASFAIGFGDVRRYLNPQSVNFYAGLVTICVVSVQLFFCYRLVIIKRSMWPVAVFIALVRLASRRLCMYYLPQLTPSVDSSRQIRLCDWLRGVVSGIRERPPQPATSAVDLFRALFPRLQRRHRRPDLSQHHLRTALFLDGQEHTRRRKQYRAPDHRNQRRRIAPGNRSDGAVCRLPRDDVPCLPQRDPRIHVRQHAPRDT